MRTAPLGLVIGLATGATALCEYVDKADLEKEGVDYALWPYVGEINWDLAFGDLAFGDFYMDPRGCTGVCRNPQSLLENGSPLKPYCECSWEYFGPECENSIWLIIFPLLALGLFVLLVCILVPYKCRKRTRLKIPPGALPGITSGALPHVWIDSVGLPPYRCPTTVGNNSHPVGHVTYASGPRRATFAQPKRGTLPRVPSRGSFYSASQAPNGVPRRHAASMPHVAYDANERIPAYPGSRKTAPPAQFWGPELISPRPPPAPMTYASSRRTSNLIG